MERRWAVKDLSFYEQVGIVIPGAVLLFGIVFYIPDLQNLLAKDGISLGGLGVFVLLAYAAGHFIAALGNLIEQVYWPFWGGMPSNWVIGREPRLLSQPQIEKLQAQVKARFGIDIPPLVEITIGTWFSVARQIYSDVEKHGRPRRVDTFNGNYGLTRGLCAALVGLAVVSIVVMPQQWYVSLTLLGIAAVYLYRMHRFGVHYARELFNQFLLLPPQPGKSEAASGRKGALGKAV